MQNPQDNFLGTNRQDLLQANLDGAGIQEEFEAIQKRQPFRNIERLSANASDVWLRTSGEPIFDDDGKFQGFRITATDITDLKRKEEALRVSEQRFRDIVDNASDWFWEMDEEFRFTWISDTVEKIVGVSALSHYGKTRAELGFTHTDTPAWAAYFAALERHEPYRDLVQHRITPEGDRWILSSGVPMLDDAGEFKGYFGTGKDITALRQAQQSNERFLEAIDRLSEAVAFFDAEDQLIICNKQYLHLSSARQEFLFPGISFEAILRDSIDSKLIATDLEDHEAWIVERLARRWVGSVPFEWQGGGKTLLISEEPLPDGGLVQTMRDVSNLKASEQQLRQAQKMEAIGQLTGGVAHDFNNLLAVLMGNLALLDEGLGPDHEHIALTAPMTHAVNRAAELTKRMLAFARLQPLDVGLVDANELLNNMQTLLHRSLAEEIVVAFSLAPKLAPCIADPGQLEQAILNLAINARDAMPNGGRLSIATECIHLSRAPSGDQADFVPGPFVVIAVEDHGSGIPEEEQLRIFDPFYTTKEIGKGTGLGLSMVYGFVKQSNGHVTVTSEAGVGTTFKLYLPVGEVGQEPAAVETRNEVVPNKSGAVVLLVEDEDDVRVLVTRILERRGYQVLIAKDGKAGIDMISAHDNIDLLLTDVMLPEGMNGRQLADAAVEVRKSLKVLFMSGYAKDAIISQGRLDPDVHLLPKPFAPATLIREVEIALAPKR